MPNPAASGITYTYAINRHGGLPAFACRHTGKCIAIDVVTPNWPGASFAHSIAPLPADPFRLGSLLAGEGGLEGPSGELICFRGAFYGTTEAGGDLISTCKKRMRKFEL